LFEIIDHGPYDELMNKSKILRDLVYSIVTEQIERKLSDAGIYKMIFLTKNQ
jgi:hypothetical protein